MANNDFNINDTPTDRMSKDLAMLKNVSDFSGMTKEEREKAEQLISRVTESILSDKMTRNQTEQNSEILKNLADKGLDVAKQAMAKVEEKKKQNESVATHLQETISQRAGYNGQVQDGKAVTSSNQQQNDMQQRHQAESANQASEKRYAPDSSERAALNAKNKYDALSAGSR